MKFITTPDSRFENLPAYPFAPNYCEVQNGMKMHYVDEGKGPIVLLLHGEPSWSFLYRKMIPILVNEGFRCIAPDLIGFGKSDKPTEKESYSYQNHIDWLTSFIQSKELNNIHLFCQDWGGLIGLRIVANHESLFSTITTSNTFLSKSGVSAPGIFKQWRTFAESSPEFNASMVLQMATVSTLSEDVLAAYNAPYPDESYKMGSRVFPSLVPFDGDDTFNEIPNCDAAWKVLEKWEKPFLTLFGDSDPITKGADMIFQNVVPGAKGRPHQVIKDGGHFIQEEKGEELAEKLAIFIKNNI